MKEVIVTGSSGFIGSYLVELMKNKGYTVIGVDIKTRKNSDVFIKKNTANRYLYDKLKNFDPEFVFHFGTPSSTILYNKYPTTCFKETTLSQFHIMKYCENKNPKKLIFPSSSLVYGNSLFPSENSHLIPSNLFGAGKIAAESIAHQSSFKNWVALRIFTGYGEGEEIKKNYSSFISIALTNILKNKPITIRGDGSQSRDFVHILDIIYYIDKITESNFSGPINIGSGQNYSFNQILDIIRKDLHLDMDIEYIPEPNQYLNNQKCDTTLLFEKFGKPKIDIKTGLSTFYHYLLHKNHPQNMW